MDSLVTVAVATYHSEKFILETLYSIFNQTYRNIELIVSDDFSTDDTLKIVNDWLNIEENFSRFTRVEIITVPHNTGVSANCNRMINAAKAEWIKFIAGDDILLPNCIEDNIAFTIENKSAKVVFSQVKLYKDLFIENNFIGISPTNFPKLLMDDRLTAKDQFELLLMSDRINYTPSYFFNRNAMIGIGCYDESNTLIEDYPMWLKFTQCGEKLFYFHKATVGYRIHANALNNTGAEHLFPPSAIKGYLVRKKIVFPYLNWEIRFSETFTYFLTLLFLKFGIVNKTRINVFIYHLMVYYLNPFYLIYSIKKKLPHNKSNFQYKN